MNAITLNSTQFNAARAIGPSVGGVVLAVLGPAWAFLGNGISFIVVFCTLLTLLGLRQVHLLIALTPS